MDLIQAILLGLIQGATEFIPVSSSGHLVLVPWLLGWDPPGLVFDTMVHWGTLGAIVAYFWRDWWALAVAWGQGLAQRDWSDPRARLAWLLVVGTLPAAVLGYLLEDFFASLFGEPQWAAFFLIVTAILLVLGEWLGRRLREMQDLCWVDALAIGFGQALAIAPGISRSGATMAVGLLRGLDRPTAARFSFLLSAPIILGAGLFQLVDLLDTAGASTQFPVLTVGFLSALITGYACIWALLRYLQRSNLLVFSIYCAALGITCLIVSWLA